MNVSPAFQAFAQEAPQHQQAWSEAVQALGAASALDDKTAALAYLAVMAAARLDSGLPFHVVGSAGLEPARPKPEDFKSPAYANSATPPRATAR